MVVIDSVRQANFIPAKVCEYILGKIHDRLARHNGEREAGIDERLSEAGLRGIVVIEVQRLRVHGQQREPRVVGSQDRATQRMLEFIADLEILVKAAGPGLLKRHLENNPREGYNIF